MNFESETKHSVTLGDILKARRRISDFVCRSPLKKSFALSEHLDKQVFLKLETAQATGAFKLRGAANKILSLPDDVRRNGVTAASSGNHGCGVAYLAQLLRIPAIVCLSDLVPVNKVAGVRSFGAEIEVGGPSQDDAVERAKRIASERGMTYIDPSDDPAIIAGAGTIGLEILEDQPDIDTLVVPLSGGGLAAGVAIAAKSIRPLIRVIGVTMDCGAAMYESQQAGQPVEIEEVATIADALQGGIGLDNHYTFQLCREYVDDFMLVSDEQIKAAMVSTLKHDRLVLEGGGASGIALLLDDRAYDFGDRIATICTGDNVDLNVLLNLARKKNRQPGDGCAGRAWE